MRGAAIVGVCLWAHLAAGARCAPPRGAAAALSLVDAQTRLAFIRAHLDTEARRARAWSWSWAGIYSAITVAQLATVPLREPDARVDAYIGAGASALGVAVLAVAPLKVMGDQRWLARRMAHAPADTDPCALVADAERLLERSARSEAFGKSALVHAGSFVFNVALGLTLVGLRHFDAAAITALTGIAVGELQIFTQPSGTIGAWQRYRSGALGEERGPPTPSRAFAVSPFLGRGRVGMALGVAF
jgi:hypothetical protein